MSEFNLDKIIDKEKTYKENVISLVMQVEENDEEIKKIREEIKKLRQKQKLRLEVKDDNSSTLKVNLVQSKKNKILKLDVKNYISLLEISTTIEDLTEFMPKVTDENYEKIINFIMLSLQKDFVFFNETIKKSNLSIEDLEFVKKEITNLNRMKNLVNEYRENVENTEIESIDLIEQNINIFYTKTESGNIKLLGDLKKIPVECYPEFSILFESIRSGNLKNPKVIKSTNRFYGNPFKEVKLNSARITFEVLSKDILVVTGAFVKKVQTSKKYDLTMINNKQLFLKNKQDLIDNMHNEEFICSQDQITEEISKILKKGK